MRKSILAAAFLVSCLLLVAQQALNNDAVIKLVKSGLPEDQIVSIINASQGTYDISSEGLIALKSAGASGKIIVAVVEKGSAQVPPAVHRNNGATGSPDEIVLPDPEFHGTVYWLDRGNNKLNALERQKPMVAAHVNPIHARNTLEVEGKRSPVRFTADSKPEFVFQGRQGVDPQTLARIVTFTVTKGHRELTTMQTSGVFLPGAREKDPDKYSVSFQSSRYNGSSIEITPTMPLKPGEYGIELQTGRFYFCFGVD
jgi:hypothetical protein